MTSVIVSGFFVGLVYGLLGIGFVIVYRGSRVVNFAYGETGMIAAMVFADLRFGTRTALYGQAVKDHGLILALPVAVLVAAAIAAATEFVVVRPLRSAPRIQVLVGTLAVGALLFALGDRLAPRRPPDRRHRCSSGRNPGFPRTVADSLYRGFCGRRPGAAVPAHTIWVTPPGGRT
jgi:branched-subunit amino acid ABC-type transport system permease component